MKNKASSFIKKILEVITTMAKTKTLALKNKTGTLRTRLMIFSVLKNRKLLMSSISKKLQTLIGHSNEENKTKDDDEDIEEQKNKGVIIKMNSISNTVYMEEEYDIEEDDQKYPDLTHSLFDLDDDFEDNGGSVIDIVKHFKEDGGEVFKLEDEIDEVADLFIKRFHRQIRMQKQLSFKMHQQLLMKG